MINLKSIKIYAVSLILIGALSLTAAICLDAKGIDNNYLFYAIIILLVGSDFDVVHHILATVIKEIETIRANTNNT